jgi:hypothetical protein
MASRELTADKVDSLKLKPALAAYLLQSETMRIRTPRTLSIDWLSCRAKSAEELEILVGLIHPSSLQFSEKPSFA